MNGTIIELHRVPTNSTSKNAGSDSGRACVSAIMENPVDVVQQARSMLEQAVVGSSA
ncbi:hypothetical protein [Falsirhodobacter deserti]|uniref:hypothetical protein n=1 Tax=Falsirhodobacter deserti TaxID=1365611 RepID=UPI001F4DA840|nr:hypothetical protein [Falsirhodobacter deserti]